jgi:lipopolysaccharide/colanic/teichoic acid biosynthesis glycosyltransferase
METTFETLKLGWLQKYSTKKSAFSGKTYLPIKRTFDLTLVILTLPFWLPLIGIITLLIRISSPGAPVIFKQKRLGKGGKNYSLYKFRTMVPNAEALIEKYAHLNELEWPDFKISNDPRVTPLGRILRRTSLDELPQLFNVLRGEMSLVGPRPTIFGSDDYHLWHTGRLDVLPGLTGLWQVTARGFDVDFDQKSRLDIAYVERQCISLDIDIILRTIVVIIKGQGSY